MDDYRTEPYEPDLEETYDWDYEDEPQPKILWGRVAALGGAMLIAFLLGRAAAPDGIPEERVQRARAEAEAAQAQVDTLTTELERARRNNQQLQAQLTAAEEEAEEEPAPQGENARVYTVESGDTLTGLAERFYDDAEMACVIAEANNMSCNAQLDIGDTLIIPEDPG